MTSRSLGSLTLSLILQYGGFEQGLDRSARAADKRMKEIEARAKKFGAFMGGAITAGAGAATAAIIGLTKNAIDYADHLNDLNQRLGVSAEALSGWAYAAQQTGTDIDALGKGLKILAKNMAEALDPKSQQAGLFRALGVEVKDAHGNLRDLESVLPEIASKFKELDNATTEAALSQQLFGKSGVDLLEFLNQGEDGLEALRQKARDLGVELSSQTLSAADEFNDKLADLKTLGLAAGVQLADQLLPTMIQLVDQFQRGVKEGGEIGRIIKWIGDQAQAAVKDLKFMYESLKAFGDVFTGLKESALGYYDLLHSIATLDFSAAAKSLERMRSGGDLVREAATRDLRANTDQAIPPGLVQEMDFTLGAPLSPQEKSGLERRVNGFLGGSSSKKKSGKSDAEREADQLKAAYDRMNESLAEQIALFGEDGEAARIRYEIEKGSLQKLSETQKQTLTEQAEWLDWMNEMADIESAWAGVSEEATNRTLENMRRMQEEADRTKAAFVDAFRFEGANAIADFVTGAKSATDAAKDFFDNLGRMVTQMIAERWMEQLFGGIGTTGEGTTGGNWIGSLFGSLFGGGMATGGWARPGTMYEVNERGFEMATVSGRDYMLTGAQPVRITPNDQLGPSAYRGALHQTTNIVVQGRITNQTADQIAIANGRETRRAMLRNGG